MSARTDALVSQQETGKIAASISLRYVRLASRRELKSQRAHLDWFLISGESVASAGIRKKPVPWNIPPAGWFSNN
jgi:hypothetical protein